VLDARRLRWYLFGAQAVIVHGRPRLSDDVDVTVEVEQERLCELVAALEDVGFEQEVLDDADDFIAVTRVVPLRHRATGMPVDIVLAGPGLEERFLESARPCDLGGVVVPVISPEHLVVTKILAGRDKDLADARGVVARQAAALNVNAVRQTLREIEEALGQSDLTPAFDRILGQDSPSGED
jgi:hypothetical protein